MSDPDFKKLSSIGAEVERLVDAGELTKVEYDRLYDEAREAANGHDEFLDFMTLHADPDW